MINRFTVEDDNLWVIDRLFQFKNKFLLDLIEG
jgi:hypothetical protein